MRACIHRGATEVGGSCVELQASGGARLVLDLGLPLEDASGSLPDVAGLADGGDGLCGIVVTHGHPDHVGLVACAHPSVPVWMGEAAARMLREASFFTSAAAISASGALRDREPFTTGPFTVTPYLIDHSGFDAYSLLVEADGRRLFYTGDLRAHGRKAGTFERLVSEPPRVDALLLEGTTISRPASHGRSEADVERECAELFRATEGIVLACYSPQNIDRLVTLYRAAKRSNRLFVMDLYAATIARATGRATIPQADWDGCRVYVPRSQRIAVKRHGEFGRINWLHNRRLYPDDLRKQADDLVLTFRGSMTREIEHADCLAEAAAVWSMWGGYLDRPSGRKLHTWLERNAVPLRQIHSPGHATVEQLQRLANAFAAPAVVPVHTDAPAAYAALFANVRPHTDGEWWSV